MEIGSVENVPDFIKRVKAGETQADGLRPPRLQKLRSARPHHQAGRRRSLRGHGHATRCSTSPWSCERIALEDDYFVNRKLYPNVDFYTGLIYQSMGFPLDHVPVLFAIPRTAGWIAQWEEMLLDPEQKIARPRQIYLGHDTRHYVPIDQRA